MRGYGHLGYLVDGLDDACAALEGLGVQFKKRPSEGNMRGNLLLLHLHRGCRAQVGLRSLLRMSILASVYLAGLAFAYDPDGYW